MSSQRIVPSTSWLLWMGFPWFFSVVRRMPGHNSNTCKARNPRLPSHWSLTSDVFCAEVCAEYECGDIQGHREPNRHHLYANSAYCKTVNEAARKYPVEYTLLLFSDQATNLIFALASLSCKKWVSWRVINFHAVGSGYVTSQWFSLMNTALPVHHNTVFTNSQETILLYLQTVT